MRKIRRILLAIAVGTWAIAVHAQDDAKATEHWAVDVQIGGGEPLIGRNDLNASGYFVGSTGSASSFLTKFHAEYFIPYTHFSIKAGYEHERMDLLSGDAETSLNQLMVGGRWYPAPWSWTIRPYVGVDALVYIGQLNDNYQITSPEGYSREICIRNPRLSLAPVVGADIYLLSHLALQLEYGFRMGVDGRMTATSTFQRMPESTFVTRSNLHRHAFSIGLKATFPFRLTENDGYSLLNMLTEWLLE